MRVLDFGLARRAAIAMTDDAEPGREGGTTDHDQSPDLPAQGRTPTGTMQAHGNDRPAFAQALTETGAVIGTPAYMPPEQLEGRETDARSDQFSFCVSLYEAVYGERPFEGSTLTELTVAMTRDGVRPAPKDRLVPTPLRTILLRGLAARAQRAVALDGGAAAPAAHAGGPAHAAVDRGGSDGRTGCAGGRTGPRTVRGGQGSLHRRPGPAGRDLGRCPPPAGAGRDPGDRALLCPRHLGA